MKIVTPRPDLLDAVNKVKSLVSPKSALPILSHILMEAKDGVLKLSATDLKVSIECTVDCTVEAEGSLTVSAQRISNMLSALPDQDITIAMGDNNVVSLTCGRIHTKLYSMAPEEFPPISEFAGVEPIVLDQDALKDLFAKTSFAICTDQARYNLTGLLVEIGNGTLTAVATDGRRMSLCRQGEGIPDGIDVKVIIPHKMIIELERLLAGGEEVRMFLDEAKAAFQFGSIRLVSALIEGTFPNYEMVIPKKHDKEALCSTGQFLEAIRRTRTMTNDKFNSVRLNLGSGTMALKVVTPEVGEYEEEMPIDYEGEQVEIAFNPDFILDVVRRITSEKVAIQFKDAMSPGLLKPFTEAPEDDYLNVIMPIRI